MIYTFYSYKGGVGRSMALANIGDILARAGLRVLMIDFDLTRLRLRPTRRVEGAGLRRSLVRERMLWLRSPVHDELW